MTTYVLVHGAWSGAHGFRHVRIRLQKEGHEVFTPSLTGIGERAHLSSPLVNLSMHVRDVVNQILYEDLNDIVLMGFSYGGFVITGALEHVADRVSHLVYLDAFVPNDGDTVILFDLNGSMIDSVNYLSSWGARGNNKTLERNKFGEWKESIVLGGTPGGKNSVYDFSYDFSVLEITEVLGDPFGDDEALKPLGEWVEIYNSGSDRNLHC